MDSGNSGSMQSSSGGDEEYDSRAESNISPFLNSSAFFGSITNQPPIIFDPPSHNLATFSQPPAHNQDANTPYNLDLAWTSRLRSQANFSDMGSFTALSSSSSSLPSSTTHTQALLGGQGLNQGPFPRPPSMSLSSGDGTAARASPQSDHQNNTMIKNPKKRTRASRRAPTTVLTTDTTNFRQMVQEFTGIPTSPFSGTSQYSRRLDLFGSAGSALRSGNQLETLGPLHPLRPSAQKVHLSPYVSSSSSAAPSWLNSNMIDSMGITSSSSTNSVAGTSNNFSSTANSYQLPSDIGLLKQSQNILNMQNSVLTFQSLLNSPLPPPLKNPLATSTIFNTKSQGSSSIPSLDEMGTLNQVPVNPNLSGFPFQKSSDRRTAQVGNDDSLTRWKDGGGTANKEGQERLGSLNGDHGGSDHHVSGYNLNGSSVPASDLLPEKGLENVSSRGEGTVDSWICPDLAS